LGEGFLGASPQVAPALANCGGTTCPPIASVACGDNFTCIGTTGGNVGCWGDDSYGQVGAGSASSTPVLFLEDVGLSHVTGLSAGPRGVCAQVSGLGLNCWGEDGNELLGVLVNYSSPTQVVFATCP
jgi:hypothetical protein